MARAAPRPTGAARLRAGEKALLDARRVEDEVARHVELPAQVDGFPLRESGLTSLPGEWRAPSAASCYSAANWCVKEAF